MQPRRMLALRDRLFHAMDPKTRGGRSTVRHPYCGGTPLLRSRTRSRPVLTVVFVAVALTVVATAAIAGDVFDDVPNANV